MLLDQQKIIQFWGSVHLESAAENIGSLRQKKNDLYRWLQKFLKSQVKKKQIYVSFLKNCKSEKIYMKCGGRKRLVKIIKWERRKKENGANDTHKILWIRACCNSLFVHIYNKLKSDNYLWIKLREMKREQNVEKQYVTKNQAENTGCVKESLQEKAITNDI
ncbi:unnamed protein product [Paramecium octaurelia]|uniref:Uncharacterized protein n=1 Tax=Paramecium octaurelia TaxID=43137 RepID=A0A8S1V9C3_PAROT|nr:unnamed protein product [Paramecium octaurelia]